MLSAEPLLCALDETMKRGNMSGASASFFVWLESTLAFAPNLTPDGYYVVVRLERFFVG